jgi:hypothetical protein
LFSTTLSKCRSFIYFNIIYILNFLLPAPGIIAKDVSGKPNKDEFVAILISQDNANSSPPPRAGPSIEAIVGKGKL